MMPILQWWRVTHGADRFFVLEFEGRIASSGAGYSMVGEVFREFRDSWESSGWKFERVEAP